ncbi:MAG: hypothetical protein PHQ32_06990 [Firmicutes bacterium]|nr:hypothetical protein [Bacillota bacterium]
MIQIRYPGRNIFINSLSTTKYQLIGQEISIGAGLGKYDKEIILPYYLVKEKINTLLAEIILIGGDRPFNGLVNIFTEDSNSAEEIIRCIKTISEEFKIDFDFQQTLVPNTSTTFLINLFSIASKEKLKVQKGREGLWIYFIKLKKDNFSIINENFFSHEFLLDIGESLGIAESYLLKDESINEGIDLMLEGTDSFHVERNHNLDVLKKYRSGSGLLIFTPYKLSKSDDDSVEIIELGSLFSKNLKYD